MSKTNPYGRVFVVTLVFLANVERGWSQSPDINNASGVAPILGEVPAPTLLEPTNNVVPEQASPPEIQPVSDPASIYNLGPDTNLIRLLDDIRDLAKNGELDSAQSLAARALEKIGRTEENSFYLRQIRKEETQLYFRRANQAMRDENYSLASQLLARYKENVNDDLEERKQKREILLENKGNKDVSLVGKLVEELDQAKKDALAAMPCYQDHKGTCYNYDGVEVSTAGRVVVSPSDVGVSGREDGGSAAMSSRIIATEALCAISGAAMPKAALRTDGEELELEASRHLV